MLHISQSTLARIFGVTRSSVCQMNKIHSMKEQVKIRSIRAIVANDKKSLIKALDSRVADVVRETYELIKEENKSHRKPEDKRRRMYKTLGIKFKKGIRRCNQL